MSKTKTFILSDESVNRYGFRVLSSGVDLDAFGKNPVMLFNHNSYGANYNGPIGKWENLRREGDQILADAVFDTNDPSAKLISDKVDNGFISSASIGFRILGVSEDPADMVQGQTGPTVTKWDMLEASVVDIPANKNALALYDHNGSRIELHDNALEGVFLSFKPKTNLDMSKTTLLPAWDGIKASLGFKDKQGQAVEVELSSEELDKINLELSLAHETKTKLSVAETALSALKTEVETLKATALEVETLKNEKTALESEKTELQNKLDQAQACLEGKGKNPFAAANTDTLKTAPSFETSYDREKATLNF